MIDSLSSKMLAGLNAGDQGAWFRFVDKFFPSVYHWCRQGGLDPEDAKDLSQEVFVNVGAGIGNYQFIPGTSGFASWLKTLTDRRIIDFRRKQAVRPKLSFGADFFKILMLLPEESVSTYLPGGERDFARKLIRIGMREFAEKTWLCFWLSVVEGLDIDDVASKLSVSKNTVYLSRSRVTRRLRELAASPSMLSFED
jgi:RNA polymerase sigma factor (sigma-70 family)